MKREFLQELGLTAEAIDKIMAENGKDVEAQKKKTETVITERDGFKDQLDTALNGLKAFEGVDVETLKGEIARLSGELDTNKTAYETKLSKIERQRETETFFNGLEQKFINEETREYYAGKLEGLLEDEKAKGKSRQELFDMLIKNEKGEVKPNVFMDGDNNQNKLYIPPMGGDITRDAKQKAFNTMGYKERAEMYAKNPELYQTIKE